MSCFASGRAARWALAFGFVLALAPTGAALAEPGVCALDIDGTRRCGALRACSLRRDCVLGAATDDYACVPLAPPLGEPRCVPDCGTMFSCGQAADCPALNGIVGTCDPVEPASGSTAPNACTYRAGTGRPAAAQITYCTAAGSHIPLAMQHACHTDPATGQLTEDYFRGDCDDDGCPNGHDTNPCTASPGSCALTAGFDSPFCSSPPALACSYDGTGVSCGLARPCRTGGAALPCDIGVCEDGWSEAPRCRPSCGTLFLCQTGTPFPEQCPMLAGQTGVCRALPAGLDPGVRRDGICLYGDFFDASCSPTPTNVDIGCFVSTAGVPTSSFWEGDCDGDGAPNACDDMRCLNGGGTNDCYTPAGGDACAVAYVPPPDAGVDAAVVDAAVVDEDAGTALDDAGTLRVDASAGDAAAADAGSAGADASVGIDGGVGSTFAGGGGCRCSAAGAGSGARGALLIALAALFSVARRRARRRW